MLTALSFVEDLGTLSLCIVQPPSHATNGHSMYHVAESRPLEVMLKIQCEVGSDHHSVVVFLLYFNKACLKTRE